MTKRTLVLLYPGAISYEVMYAIECLGAYGKVDITTPENHNHTDSSGLRICPTVNFEDICLITDYQALLIPWRKSRFNNGKRPKFQASSRKPINYH